jgi:RNA polymerase sigma-70 factor (ECF subfamily)
MEGSDYKLVQAIGDGNREAFEQLVKRYQKSLFNFIYRYLGEKSTAEDLTQEVFLRVFLAARRFEERPGASVSTWIYRIAYHLSLNEIKRQKRFLRISNHIEDTMQGRGERSPADLIEVQALKQTVVSGLRLLPENQRAALLLRVNEGLSYQEISEVLGVSFSSVESLLFRARQTLRQHLEKEMQE